MIGAYEHSPDAAALFFRVSPEIESEKVLKYLVVGDVLGPAVCVGDSGVELGVYVGEPGGSGIVETGESASGVGGAPVFSELV